MKFNKKVYKEFVSPGEAAAWGKQNYSDWLPELQRQDYSPQTPAEKFFRYYTGGIHHVYNNILRKGDLSNYDDKDSVVKMIIEGIREINNRELSENIVVYRFISKEIVKYMKKWSGVKLIRRGAELVDKGFMSTTLSLGSVCQRHYATLKQHSLFKIYVPKGTHCVYVDLVADMSENEIIFAPGTKLKVIGSCFGKYVECVVVN